MINHIRDAAILAVLALFLWAPLGMRFAAWFRLERKSIPFAVRTAAGMGLWGLIVLALGSAGLLRPWMLIAGALALFLALRLDRCLPVGRPRSNESPSPAETLATAVLALVALFYFVLICAKSLVPETAFDSLNVHLPYARQAAAAARIGFEPNNWSSIMPALPLMSYITAFALSGVALAKLMNALCLALGGGIVYGFLLRRWGRLRALAAALLVWSSPVAVYEATTALIDLPLLLYSAICIFALFEWIASAQDGWLQISAVGLGFALGCKYHAVFWLVPALAIVAWHGWKHRKWSLSRVSSALAVYAGIAGALLLPWLVRAWHYSGNPVFPLANEWFRSPYFTPAMDQAAKAAYANEGVGTGFMNLLLLPWTVTFHPGPFRGTLGYIFLPGVVLGLFRGRHPEIRYGFCLAAFYFYAWAMSAQEIRYLLPLLPLLAMISAAGFLGLPGAGESSKARPLSWAPGAVVVLAGGLMAAPMWYERLVPAWTYWHSFQSPWAFLAGRQSVQEYLRRDVPSIYVYDFINARLSQSDRVLLLNDASQFYSRVPTLYSFTVEAERILLEESEEGILRRLRESRVSHVLLNYNGIAPISGVVPRKGAYFFLDRGFQSQYLEEIFASNKVSLYRVIYPIREILAETGRP